MTLEKYVKHYTNSVLVELFAAGEKFPKFNSAHEGYGVILEELDELWDEVKKKPKNWQKMEREAIQVSAMALRFIVDLKDKYEGKLKEGTE